MNLGNFFDNSNHTDTAPKGTGGGATEQQAGAKAQDIASAFYDKPADAQVTDDKEEPNVEVHSDDEDRAAKLFGESIYDDTLLVTDDHPEATPEQIKAANEDYRAELRKMELPAQLARSLTESFTTSMARPLSDADYEAKIAGFEQGLADRFGGAEHVEERLADVAKLLSKASPEVVDGLVESGLNYDVDVIAVLADHARSLKGRGRLK